MKRFSLLIIPVVVVALIAMTAHWLFATDKALCCEGWAIQPSDTRWPFGLWVWPLSVFSVFGGLAAWFAYRRFCLAETRQARSKATTLAVASLSFLALIGPWSLFGPTPDGKDRVTTVVSAVWSDVTTAFFELAYKVDNPRTFSAEYADRHQVLRTRFKARVQTHPPGTTLFYYAARRVYEAVPPLQSAFEGLAQKLTGDSIPVLAARGRSIVKASSLHSPEVPDSAVGCALWITFLFTLSAMLTVPAVYLLGAGRGQNDARGLLAAALFALTPSVGLFGLGSDVLIAFGAAWTMVLLLRHLDQPGWRHITAAGALVALTSFISFGAAAIGVVVCLAILLSALGLPHQRGSERVRGIAPGLLLFGGGFGLIWLLLILLFPMQPLRIYRLAMDAHHQATIAHRDYGEWLFMNLVVFALFAGWSLSISIMLPAIFRSSIRIPNDNSVVIGRAGILTALLLTVSGGVRGEVERLWMFLLPAVCVLGAASILAVANPSDPGFAPDTGEPQPRGAAARRRGGVMVIGLLLLQATQTVMMAIALSPLIHHRSPNANTSILLAPEPGAGSVPAP